MKTISILSVIILGLILWLSYLSGQVNRQIKQISDLQELVKRCNNIAERLVAYESSRTLLDNDQLMVNTRFLNRIINISDRVYKLEDGLAIFRQLVNKHLDDKSIHQVHITQPQWYWSDPMPIYTNFYYMSTNNVFWLYDSHGETNQIIFPSTSGNTILLNSSKE